MLVEPEFMNRKTTSLIALIASLSLSSFFSLSGKEESSSAVEKSSNDSDLFPGKILDSTGKSVSSDVLDGKIVGIYFSAQWCPPCRHFTPSLVEFRNKTPRILKLSLYPRTDPLRTNLSTWKNME
jgi:thiol-disulfide isomerase/thioredoxin